MRTWHPWSPRTTGAAVLLATLAVGGPVLGITGANVGSIPVLRIVIAALVLLLVLLAVIKIAATLSGFDPDAPLIAAQLAPLADQQDLLARWLQRTRWARNVGGYTGIAWWVFGTHGQGDPLLFGIGGVALGSMAAQLHQIRRRTGPRTASLDPRALSDYLPDHARRRMIAVAAAASIMVVAGLAISEARPSARWATAAIAVLVLVHAVQRRVAARPRPAVTIELRHADDLARELAVGRGLAYPATYLSLAMIAHGAAYFEPSIGAFATAVSTLVWLYALRSWMQNRRLGLDYLIDEPQPARA